MIWLLMIIHLGGDPVSVVDSRIGDTFQSEQACIKKMKSIFKQADKDGQPVPPEINLGCVPFGKQGV